MKLLTGSSPVRLAVAMVCAALVVALQPGASATEHATDQVQVPVLAQTAVQTPGKTRAILTMGAAIASWYHSGGGLSPADLA